MRKVIAVSAAILIAPLGIAVPASAFEGGGRKPSEAPSFTVGQHYTGQLNNHENDANYSGYREVRSGACHPSPHATSSPSTGNLDFHSRTEVRRISDLPDLGRGC